MRLLCLCKRSDIALDLESVISRYLFIYFSRYSLSMKVESADRNRIKPVELNIVKIIHKTSHESIFAEYDSFEIGLLTEALVDIRIAWMWIFCQTSTLHHRNPYRAF